MKKKCKKRFFFYFMKVKDSFRKSMKISDEIVKYRYVLLDA